MSVLSWLGHAKDQIDVLDNGKTFKNPSGNGQSKSVLKQAGDTAVGVGKSIVHPFAWFAKTDIINPAKEVAAEFTGNKKAEQNAINSQFEGTKSPTAALRQIAGNTAQVGLTFLAPGANAVEGGVAKAVGEGIGGKILAAGAKGAVAGSEFNVAGTVAGSEPLTAKTLLKSAAQGAAAGAVLGAGFEAIKPAYHALKAGDKVIAETRASEYSGLHPSNVITDNGVNTLNDYKDLLHNDYKGASAEEINKLHVDARNFAQNAGIDITSGSADEIAGRIDTYKSQRLQHINAVNKLATTGAFDLGKGTLADKLAGETDAAKIKNALDEIVPPEKLETMSKAIASTNDPKVVSNILKGGHDIPPEVTPPPVLAPKDVKTAIDQEVQNRLNNPAPETPAPVDTSVAPSTTPSIPKPAEQITNPELRSALDNATKKTNVNLSINPENTIKTTAKGIRTDYSGELNSAKLAGQQLADTIHKVAPGEEKGIFWFNEAKGSIDQLQKWATEAAKEGSALAPHLEDIKQALTLTPQAKEAAAALTEYYKAAGENATEQGTLKGIKEDYGNARLYEQEKSTGANTGDLLKQTTKSAKQRTYDTVAEAIQNGKKPLTTDAADLAAIHNSELARVNTTRNLLDNMEKGGLGQWVDVSKGSVPKGFEQIGNLRKGTQVFAAPEELAKKLRPITEPDFVRRVDGWRKIQAYQGLVKTVDLSYSFFHHITEAAQLLYNTKLGADILTNTKNIVSKLDTPEFAQAEQDFAKAGGITSKVEGVQDIIRNLGKDSNEGLINKVKNVPGLKQAFQLSDKSSEFLFDKAQRWLKVNDYNTKVTSWLEKHSEATPEEFKAASQGYAKEINASYGGLNWQALGVTKTTQSVLRGILLAPDWVISNLELAKYGISGGTEGAAARAHIFTALASSTIATQALNYSITGHFTNENPKGHEFDVQLAPNVYVTLYRGGIGDMLKLAENIQENGLAQGTARFSQGKLSPIARTTVGLLSGTQFTGQSISNPNDSFATKSGKEAKFIAQNLVPIPFGAVSTAKYVNEAKKTGQPVNPYIAASLASGVSRFSKTSSALSDRQNATIELLTKNGGSKEQQKAYQQYFLTAKKTSKDRTAASRAIDDALFAGDLQKAKQLATDYNKKYAASFKGWAAKYSQYGDKTLTKDYNSNKINLTKSSLRTRLKSIKANPLYGVKQ